MAQASSVQGDPVLEEMLASIRQMIENPEPYSSEEKKQESLSDVLSFPSAAVVDKKVVAPSCFSDSVPLKESNAGSSFATDSAAFDFSMDSLVSQLEKDLENTLSEVVKPPLAYHSRVSRSSSVSFSSSESPFSDSSSTFTLQEDVASAIISPDDFSMRNMISELERELQNAVSQVVAPSPPVSRAPLEESREAFVASQSHAPPGAPVSSISRVTLQERRAASVVAPQNHVQVSASASFPEVLSSLSRSSDERAIQILRPMLQEWMDNNLPLLVEKMIREEMDRIVSGGS